MLAGVLRFEGYREWTESLGPDREWYIQLIQSRTYQVIQMIASEAGGIALPLRYDVQALILPGSINGHEFINQLRKSLSPYSPTPVRITLLCGEVPEVLSRVKDYEGLGDYCEPCCIDEVAVAHVDLNYFTLKTIKEGPYRTYAEIIKLVSDYVSRLEDYAVIQYLGGDNVVAITSPSKLNEVLKVLTGHDHVKVGVGISSIPREAFSNAAKALTEIRRGGRRVKYVIRRSEGKPLFK